MELFGIILLIIALCFHKTIIFFLAARHIVHAASLLPEDKRHKWYKSEMEQISEQLGIKKDKKSKKNEG